MKKKIIIIIIAILILLTGFIAGIAFRSNYKIRSPFEPVIKVSVSDVSPTPIKNQQETALPAVLVEKRTSTTSEDSIKEKIIKTFSEEPEIMLAITEAESHFKNEASTWCCHGVMQIHEWEHRDKIPTSHNETRKGRIAWLRDPDNNIEVGRMVYDESGKNAWVVFTDGSYLRYLQQYL